MIWSTLAAAFNDSMDYSTLGWYPISADLGQLLANVHPTFMVDYDLLIKYGRFKARTIRRGDNKDEVIANLIYVDMREYYKYATNEIDLGNKEDFSTISNILYKGHNTVIIYRNKDILKDDETLTEDIESMCAELVTIIDCILNIGIKDIRDEVTPYKRYNYVLDSVAPIVIVAKYMIKRPTDEAYAELEEVISSFYPDSVIIKEVLSYCNSYYTLEELLDNGIIFGAATKVYRDKINNYKEEEDEKPLFDQLSEFKPDDNPLENMGMSQMQGISESNV